MDKVMVYALMLALAVVYVGASSTSFHIKHRATGKYVIIMDWLQESWFYRVRLHSSPKSPWTFCKVINHWGYIEGEDKNWVIVTYQRSLDPAQGSHLILAKSRDWSALWAFNAVNDHIIHKGGRFVHHTRGLNQPRENEPLATKTGTDDGMRFRFVSTSDLDTDVHIYGTPTIAGNWKIINMVRNPIATHTDTLEIKIGMSKTASVTSNFQYSWEVQVGFNDGLFFGTVTTSMQHMIERTTSTTWEEEVIRTRVIIVAPGQTAVTWQYVFEIEQNLSKSIFNSNFLADTDNEDNKPDEIQMEI